MSSACEKLYIETTNGLNGFVDCRVTFLPYVIKVSANDGGIHYFPAHIIKNIKEVKKLPWQDDTSSAEI